MFPIEIYAIIAGENLFILNKFCVLNKRYNKYFKPRIDHVKYKIIYLEMKKIYNCDNESILFGGSSVFQRVCIGHEIGDKQITIEVSEPTKICKNSIIVYKDRREIYTFHEN